MHRILVLFLSLLFLLPQTVDAKPRKRKGKNRTVIVTSPIGFSLSTGFPLVAGAGLEYRLARGFYVDGSAAMGLSQSNSTIATNPMFELGLSNIIRRGPTQTGFYLRASSSFDAPQTDLFASVGLNLRMPKRGGAQIFNVQFGPLMYFNDNAKRFFGNQFGGYLKLAYYHHPITAKKRKKRRRRRRR